VETNWKNKVSTLALASSVNFQELKIDEESKIDDQLFIETNFDDKKDSIIDISYHPMITKRAPDSSEKCVHMTGRELVAYLIKSNHLGEVKSFYLNFETIDDYKPYGLVTVPKSMVS
jgi:hypothetical protein